MRNTPVAEDKNEKTIKTQEDNTTFADGRIVYKVQIGAFKNNIPYNAIESFLSIRDKGITRQTDDRGLHIFYAGEFTDFSSASRLREEITATGLTDAFVVALRNGKRIVITDDMKSVNR
jgi:hypothetical protein